MKTIIKTLLLTIISMDCFSQSNSIIHLWPGKVPGELKEKRDPVLAASQNDNVIRFSEVTDPVIEIFLPLSSVNNKGGVIVCPGGGYQHLTYDKEGTEIGIWLNKLGYTAFVLQYRVPNKMEGALQDIQRAMRVIRKNAIKWNLDPEKLGVMGFSAGGSLSALASTGFNKKTYSPVDGADSLSARPAFAILIYPGMLDAGVNKTLTPELVLNNETPPMFIFQAADDFVGNSSIVMARALRDAKLPFELHIVPSGGHGYGMRPGNPAAETWPLLAEKWLKWVQNPKK